MISWETLIQFGPWGLFVGYLMWRDKVLNKTIQNHFHHSEMAYEKMVGVIEANTKAMTEVKINTDKCPLRAISYGKN